MKKISLFHSNCNLFFEDAINTSILSQAVRDIGFEKRNWCQWTVNDDEIPISERSDAKIYAANAYVTVIVFGERFAVEMAAKAAEVSDQRQAGSRLMN